MTHKTLNDLFVDELKDALDAEMRLIKALPKMADAAKSEELANAFTDHLEETKQHVERLETILDSIDAAVTRKTCKAMVGLLEEGKELMDEDGSPDLKDTALIAAARKVEHYEMATYGCLRAWAEKLGESDAVRLLTRTLDEESAADTALSEIADRLSPEVEIADSDENELEMADRSTMKAQGTGGKKSTTSKPRSH